MGATRFAGIVFSTFLWLRLLAANDWVKSKTGEHVSIRSCKAWLAEQGIVVSMGTAFRLLNTGHQPYKKINQNAVSDANREKRWVWMGDTDETEVVDEAWRFFDEPQSTPIGPGTTPAHDRADVIANPATAESGNSPSDFPRSVPTVSNDDIAAKRPRKRSYGARVDSI